MPKPLISSIRRGVAPALSGTPAQALSVSLRLASFVGALTIAGCSGSGATSPANAPVTLQGQVIKNLSLPEARQGFKTVVRPAGGAKEPVAEPPPEVFSKVTYESPVGPLAAYLSPDPKDGAKHPAIIWITGGDCNTIGDVWSDAPPSNDQTACAFRKAAIIMMFPSLRGGNDNPGVKEGFLGEVDDVVAAADYFPREKPFKQAAERLLGFVVAIIGGGVAQWFQATRDQKDKP